MTHTESGMYGAKRATWRDENPRVRLRSIIQQHSASSEKVWRELFWEQITTDETQDELRAVVAYWFDNNLRSILKDRGPIIKRHRAAAYRAAAMATEEAKAQLSKRINEEALRIVLLDLVMPNGKVLFDCTGRDCQHFGGWFVAIAKKVPPKAKVGDTLSEQQVFNLWQANKDKK
jgi:hypothetical protein